MIDALPAAIYTTDAKGRITHFNPACVEFSGRTPVIGSDQWCVTWKLFHPDGRPMPHDECPMATALKEGRVVRDAEAIAERPDGTRIWFMPYPTPLFDDTGKLIGGVNMLVDITERKAAEARIRADADALTKLNELSSRLWKMQSLREGLDEMLAATIELLGADFGNIQIFDPQRRVLLIEAQRGFQQEFLDFFREVRRTMAHAVAEPCVPASASSLKMSRRIRTLPRWSTSPATPATVPFSPRRSWVATAYRWA